MLGELVELWPGGPSLSLGLYLVVFRYIFAVSLLVWAAGLIRWRSRWWLISGPLVLTALSWLVLTYPLERPYGLVEGERGLVELGDAMVATARADASEGSVTGVANPAPLWSGALAIVSGFCPEKLLSLYRWLPFFVTLALGFAVAWWTSRLTEDERMLAGVLPGLAIFFVLFLSGSRLDFLGQEGSFWPAYLWATPRVGFGLALAALFLGVFAGRSVSSQALSVLTLAALGWTNAVVACTLAMASVPFLWFELRARRLHFHQLLPRCLVVLTALLLFLPFRSPSLSWEVGSLSFAHLVNEMLSQTMDRGLILLLAVTGVVRGFASSGERNRFFSWATVTSLLVWLMAIIGIGQGEAIRWLSALIIVVMAVAASYGACVVLGWFERSNIIDAKCVTGRLVLAVFVAVTLPWCFPYWWHPVRMDRTYVASLPEIAEAVRGRLESDAVVAIGTSYASWVPALAGRQILLMEGGWEAKDRTKRELALTWILRSGDPNRIAAAAREWGITHVAWGRLDESGPEEEFAAVDGKFFQESKKFVEVWRLRRWLTVYAYDPDL